MRDARRCATHSIDRNYHACEMRDNSMAIHLVGETINAKRAHQRAQTGEFIQLVGGIYIDQDVDAAVLGHAVRIAHCLYSNVYLSSGVRQSSRRHRTCGFSSAAAAINGPGCATW